MGKFDIYYNASRFRFGNGEICQDYYPGAFVSYSRGLRALTLETQKDRAFVGNMAQMVRHILYMSVSNQVVKNQDGTALFDVSLSNGPQFQHRLKVLYERGKDGKLEHVGLMLENEKG